jgi:hypothetical protein
MGLFSKKKNEPSILPPEPLPVISGSDLADAKQIMDQWDASMGNSDAMWDCMGIIGRRGGYRGDQATLMETMNGRHATEVLNRPWRWWNEAARAANYRGQDELAGRIFMFTHLFVTQFAPKMNVGNEFETGLVKPQARLYKDIAALAVDSLSKLAPESLIHNTATGKVDVVHAIQMAEQVSGVKASAQPSADLPATHSTTDDGSQWNSL